MDLRRWSLLASEIEETGDEVIARIEAPGLQKADCQVIIEDNLLRMNGEKRMERVTDGSTYHMTERTYGAFHRTSTLPRSVDAHKTVASYENGVLTARMPKKAGSSERLVRISKDG